MNLEAFATPSVLGTPGSRSGLLAEDDNFKLDAPVAWVSAEDMDADDSDPDDEVDFHAPTGT